MVKVAPDLGTAELARHHAIELGEDPKLETAGLRVGRITTQRTIDRLLRSGAIDQDQHRAAERLYLDWYRSCPGGYSPRSSCVPITVSSAPEMSDGAVHARARVAEAFAQVPKQHSALVAAVVLYDQPAGKRGAQLSEALAILAAFYWRRGGL